MHLIDAFRSRRGFQISVDEIQHRIAVSYVNEWFFCSRGVHFVPVVLMPRIVHFATPRFRCFLSDAAPGANSVPRNAVPHAKEAGLDADQQPQPGCARNALFQREALRACGGIRQRMGAWAPRLEKTSQAM